MSKAVIVTDYDPAWPAMFERLRAPIWAAIGDVATAIEHVGGTSVPGLAAKPIIDISIVVPTPAALATVIDRLATIGYVHRGDLGVPGREAFRRPDGLPVHHLYACVTGADALRNHLAVREALRADPQLTKAYGDLKKQLAAKFRDDIDSYIEGKSDFVLGILARAGFSADQIAAIRAINAKQALVRSLRDELNGWVDWDHAMFHLAVLLGLMANDPRLHSGRAKHVFWSANPIGNMLSAILDQLVAGGVLERRDEPDVQCRWNRTFRGSWES